ncbi:calcium-transporting P-type ATPase, PMR1-type [Planobispora rosea]|uniref:Calcium-transporting P-type ATPase, PMR1-type n=1 Tax=Planobispora rosea TaxID=35762 RepID=A0A8J3SBM7_PLARO|nr:cation-transporting P-type ATPase [Planobispora rosea]GGT03874.1 calcium-transporting P-type ATPase, PMR1-type [Planobispora rosea]GIH88779.1 calcium-transporting P-type ATPase, PMR1-type [Planobispora rosea]
MEDIDLRTADGLSQEAAARLLAAHGPNTLPQPHPPSLAARALRQLADPLSVLLLIAGLITLVVLREVPEGAAILAILLVNVVIGVSQETKADQAVRALRTLTAPMAKVRRDGTVRRIPAAEVVPGDVIEVAAGDRVPADARILSAGSLAADEAMLTGESLSADKHPTAPAEDGTPLGDRKGELFSGTLIVRGTGTALVTRTGADTEMGRIAGALEGGVKSPLERDLAQASRRIGVLAVAAGTAMVLIGLTRVSQGQAALLDIILAGVALAIAAVPESMAAAVTTAMALGSQRMARLGVIVRKLSAIEALGATTVIATDKTGTLTTGRLTVTDQVIASGIGNADTPDTDRVAVPGAERADAGLWRAALRCNDARDGLGDAVDVALQAAATAHDVRLPPGESRLAERPFDAETRSMTVLTATAGGPLLTVKGAPEVVLARCVPGPEVDRLTAAVPELASRGLRVLALATSQSPVTSAGSTGFAGSADRDAAGPDVPAVSANSMILDVDDLPELDATGLTPAGLVALSDEIRSSARTAVADCRAAGIRVVMVTGDHADTARAVAADVGIEADPVITGATLDSADRDGAGPDGADRDGSGRAALLRRAGVVARVDPAAKLDLVRALRASGEVVTMTGDGVNDAPALRHADVGVAMAGDEGTDVAREAAAVVVTNGELGTIVTGIRHGRRLHHNVASMIGYLLTGNLAEIFLVLVGLLLWPDLVVPLLPVHLLWINLVLDGIPAIVLGIDRPAGDPLTLRPRRNGLLSRPAVTEMALRALLIGALVFAAVEVARHLGWSDEQVRTQAVLALVFARLTLAYVTRARRWTFERGWWHGRAVLIAVTATLALQTLVTLVPPLGALLVLVPLPPLGWAMALAAGLATPFLCDLLRLIRPREKRVRRSRSHEELTR